jgi:hypothetical protein
MHHRNSGIKRKTISSTTTKQSSAQDQLDSPGNGWSAFLRSSLDPLSDHEQPGDRAGGMSGNSWEGLSGKLFWPVSRGHKEGLSSTRTSAGPCGRRSARRAVAVVGHPEVACLAVAAGNQVKRHDTLLDTTAHGLLPARGNSSSSCRPKGTEAELCLCRQQRLRPCQSGQDSGDPTGNCAWLQSPPLLPSHATSPRQPQAETGQGQGVKLSGLACQWRVIGAF